MIKADFRCCLTRGKPLLVKNAYDFRRQLGLELFDIGVLISKITENITAAFDNFQFFCHCN